MFDDDVDDDDDDDDDYEVKTVSELSKFFYKSLNVPLTRVAVLLSEFPSMRTMITFDTLLRSPVAGVSINSRT